MLGPWLFLVVSAVGATSSLEPPSTPPPDAPEALYARLGAMNQAGRAAWVQSTLAKLDRANQVFLDPAAVRQQHARVEKIMGPFIEGKPDWRRRAEFLNHELRLSQHAAVEHLSRSYRIVVYNRYRLDRAEYDHRREALALVIERWNNAGALPAQEQEVMGWLLSGIQRSAKAESLPALPRFAPGAAPATSVAGTKPPEIESIAPPAVAPSIARPSIPSPPVAEPSLTPPPVARPSVTPPAVTPPPAPPTVAKSPVTPPPPAPAPSVPKPADAEPIVPLIKPPTHAVAAPLPSPAPADTAPKTPPHGTSENEPRPLTAVRKPPLESTQPVERPAVALPATPKQPEATAVVGDRPVVAARQPAAPPEPLPAPVPLGGLPVDHPAAESPSAATSTPIAPPAVAKPTPSLPPRVAMSSPPAAAREHAPAESPAEPRFPASQSAPVASPQPSAAREPMTRARINLDELAAQIKGNNLAIQKLSAELGEKKTWNATQLATVTATLEPLAVRKDDLTMACDLLSPSELARVGTLESPAGIIAELGEKIAAARLRVKSGQFPGTESQRQAEMEMLDVLSQKLAALVFGQP